MAVRYKKRGPRRRTYIRRWREHAKLSQDQLADLIGTSGATISRVERGEPYTQDLLEAIAEAVGATEADLLMRDPSEPPERALARAILERPIRT